MSNPLADINNICMFDTETRAEDDCNPSDGSVVTAGTYRYAKRSFVIVLTACIGDKPVFERHLPRFDRDFMLWEDMPYELREFHKRVEQREAWYGAWNAGFDRQAWNNGTADFPILEPENIIDVMAQAIASNLPGKLDGASKAITGRGKQDDGQWLINLFCSANGATPEQRPEEWKRFLSYARRDTSEMRDVWKATRPLPLEEWEDYWVSERINDRGVMLDIGLADRAGRMADAEAARLNRELVKWTNGQIDRISQTKRIAEWLYDNIQHSEGRALLVKEFNDNASVDGDDLTADLKVGKLTIAKDRIEAALAFYADLDERQGLSDRDKLIVDVLQARQFGGSSSPQKFHKMMAQHVDGVLHGQYVFNGARQTGRFSSKGVQVHNLTRSHLGEQGEQDAIEFIMDNIEAQHDRS